MAGVRLEFAQFGHFDYFNIYRNSVSTAIENLEQPIGTSSTMYYEDFTTEPNNDYYYRIGVVRDSIEEFSEEIHVRTEVMFDPPYNLIVEFRNDESNRLELNWSLDGFVDEQRYYCSETLIELNALPVPKAVLAGDVRTYIDTAIEVGKTYYVAVGAVKGGVEKVSQELEIFAGSDEHWDKVVALLHFNGGLVDKVEKGVYTKTNGVDFVNDAVFGEPAIKIANTQDSVTTTNNSVWQFSDQDFCIEFPLLALDISEFQSILSKWQSPPRSSDEFLLSLYQGSLYLELRGNDGLTYVLVFKVDATQLLQKTQITLSRQGDKFRLWFGDVLKSEFSSNVIINTSEVSQFRIGGNPYTGTTFNGYIGKMRVTRGASRYSLTNTPPPVANY